MKFNHGLTRISYGDFQKKHLLSFPNALVGNPDSWHSRFPPKACGNDNHVEPALT